MTSTMCCCSKTLITFILALVSVSHANLMAVDLGLGYIKVAVARPGKGLELVTNEQSKRKTPAAVGFTHEGERLFGDAAIAYAAKAPARAILDGRSLIGKCSLPQDSSSTLDPTPFCPHHRLDVDGVGKFTGEEVVAMILGMAKRQASAALGGAAIKDIAITVPVWYDERQRMAISDAARVIGLNCLGVVNTNTAAALKYALDGKAKPTEEAIAAEKEKDKKKRAPKTITQRVLFYDLGAGSAAASVAQITTDVKTGIASNVKMLSHAWETGIGGRSLDSVIVERLADAFDLQRGAGATPSRTIPRVMMRLRKEAQRVREVLSANTETFVSVASLYDDLDLKTTFNRADFESDAKPMLDLIGGPAKAALTEAGLTSADLDAVVPFGGASRTPKVQEIILRTLSRESLNKSINTDEAAVMGAVFFGASLSSTFRVRKLDSEDVFGRSVSAEIEKEAKSGGLFSGSSKKPFQNVELFPEGTAKMPSKKTLSLNRKNDFGIQLFLDIDKTGKARFSDRHLYSKIQVKGVSEVLKKLKDSSKAKNLTPRVAITFHIDRSGLIRVGTAESSVDETIVVEREVEVQEEKNETVTSEGKDGKDEIKDNQDSDAESTQKKMMNDETETTGKDDEKNGKGKKKKPKKKTKIEKSKQTIVHRHALQIVYDEEEGLLGKQMSGKDLDATQKVLKDLEIADKDRVERADALNALEGFILEIRPRIRELEEDDDLYKVSTQEERNGLIQACDEGEDWMYTEEAKQTINLRNKQNELVKLYEPMASRAMELSVRPDAFKALVQGADAGVKEANRLRKLHVERKSEHVEELDEFINFCESVKSWVGEKETAQSKLPLTEAPAVTLTELKNKGLELKGKAGQLRKLKLPPAPTSSQEKPVEEGEEQKDEGSNSTSSESSAGKDEEVVDDAEVPPDPKSDSAKADAASGATKEEL